MPTLRRLPLLLCPPPRLPLAALTGLMLVGGSGGGTPPTFADQIPVLSPPANGTIATGSPAVEVVRIAWTEVAVLLDQECRLATGWYVGATIVVSGAPFPHVAELPVRTRAPRVASPGLRAPAVLYAAISPLRMRSEIA